MQSESEREIRISALEKRVRQFAERVEALNGRKPITVPVATLAPEPFRLLKTMQIVVEPMAQNYVATFFDADIGICGPTAEEAVDNVKALIVDIFEDLERDENENRLGPGPETQLKILREFIARRP